MYYVIGAFVALVLFNSYRTIARLKKSNDLLVKTLKNHSLELINLVKENHELKNELSQAQVKYTLDKGVLQ